MVAMADYTDGTRAWYHPLALLQRLAIYAVISYVVICVFLFALQTTLLYPGTSGAVSLAAAQAQARAWGFVPWSGAAEQGYVRTDFTQPAPRGTLVVLHGNGDSAVDRSYYADAFHPRGFRTFLYEYPGYYGRPGQPSEKTIVPEVQALVRSLDQAGYGPVYIWGESLGAGVASAACADGTLPVHGLVLQCPWDTLAHTAGYHYPIFPVSLLLKDRYDSISNLKNFAHPICVIRGTIDPVIPPHLNLSLYEHLPAAKKMIVQEGYGHGDWPVSVGESFWDDALNFIAPSKPLFSAQREK